MSSNPLSKEKDMFQDQTENDNTGDDGNFIYNYFFKQNDAYPGLTAMLYCNTFL